MNIQLLPLETLLVLGMTSGVIALTLTRAHVFEWLRNLVVNLANLIHAQFAKQIDTLVHCHYCTGHWVSLFLVILAINLDGPAHFVVTWFSVVAVSALFSSTVNFLLERAH